VEYEVDMIYAKKKNELEEGRDFDVAIQILKL
jgi:hypothetical protein